MMQVLTPSLAARFAAISYSTDTTDGVEGSAYYGALSRHFDFDSDSVKGISGSILERVFRHRTPFGCIAKGKTNAFKGHYVLALRGTAKMRDCITDLHCGVSTGPNNQSVHAGFNQTFNSLKSQLEQYFSNNPTAPVHVVGHSLGGALANLAANWLKQRFKVPVKLYTFGAPRVGLSNFANHTQNALQGVYRCLHAGDPVPMVPVWPFVHTTYEYILNSSPSISPGAHSMSNPTPGYLNTASKYKTYEDIQKGFELRYQEATRLEFEKRHQASFNALWARKIGAALLDFLNKIGAISALQVSVTGLLTVYDAIASYLANEVETSRAYAAEVKGIVGHMYVFCGLPASKLIDFSYRGIRAILKKMLIKLSQLAKFSIELASHTAHLMV
ncbi:lipase family protein [Pseudoalteromonas sp. 20-92]|uniref:lipase family protein n=1 Tax=Pseudoalteromonas sp. 20-92 TaxID=2969394 RepID=UPI0027B4B313|nr:lipase family protein [Pseudoalteromonas sp. 20-92]MDQ2045387.1 lipase family protein [Pseudoalteromonas sp. 20-92]